MNIERILERWPDLWSRLATDITPARARDAFVRLADTPAPSQLARFSRGVVIDEMVKALPVAGNLHYEQNLRGTGTVALATGQSMRKPVWLLAHLDTISYAVSRREDARYLVIPLCYHHARHGSQPARALRYEPESRSLETVTMGRLVTEAEGQAVYFEPDAIQPLPAGTRIVYHSRARIDETTLALEGNIDNAFACAAAYLAATVLAALRSDTSEAPDVLVAFPDEEEGVVSAGNQAFCKGSTRLFHRTPQDLLPDLVLVSDVQEAGDMRDGPAASLARTGGGATYSEVSSRGRGGIVPPPLVSFARDLSLFLAQKEILLQENSDGYVSRGDEVSAMLYTPNIAVLGFLGTHRHFDEGVPEANLGDLVHLAKTLVVYALIAQDRDWREMYIT